MSASIGTLRAGRVDWRWIASIIAISCLLGAMLGHPQFRFAVLAFSIFSLSLYLALRHPLTTIALIAFLGALQDATQIATYLGQNSIRLTDPISLAVLVSLVLKIMTGTPIERRSIPKALFFLFALFGWLALQLAASYPRFGFNALGEFRTHYMYLFLVPYVGMFGSSREERARLLKGLITVSLLFVFAALLRVGLDPNATLNVRVLSATSGLALLFGLVGALILANRRMLEKDAWIRVLAVPSGLLIVFTAHRSVWLASIVALVVLLLVREFGLARKLQVLLVAILALFGAFVALSSVGQEPIPFVEERARAFTDPTLDPTSAWHQYLWEQSLARIEAEPWQGQGLGTYFQLRGPAGEIVATSPHNLYLSIPLQVGVPGLFLYLGFVLTLLAALVRASRSQATPSTDRAIITMGMVVLLSASTFYIAYPLEGDWMSWAYVGLAVAALRAGSANSAPPTEGPRTHAQRPTQPPNVGSTSL